MNEETTKGRARLTEGADAGAGFASAQIQTIVRKNVACKKGFQGTV